MCGIVGVVSSQRLDDSGWLMSATDSLSHRGPDDSGTWKSDNERVAFGHRRLAVLDLSSDGHQPMHSVNKDLTIVYNGEIYNFLELRAECSSLGYQFHTSTDTEVILAGYSLWGTEVLDHLDGMFALAIYDHANGTVLLARDRAGEKPLFYSLVGNELYFASELKAIMAVASAPRVNYEALDLYMAMGFVPHDKCILDGFRKLPPASAMLFSLTKGLVKTWSYWSVPDYDPRFGLDDFEGQLDQLEKLLEKSIRQQLVADVPVGVLLSGGVDSSLITGFASRVSPSVKTFTIGFPGHGSKDERTHARLIANYFGTEHTELTAEPELANLLPKLAYQFDEPIVDSSMIPTFLVSQLVRQHCTVALGGDGGDELFGGYEHYSRMLWLRNRKKFLPEVISSTLGSLSDLLPEGFKGKNWLSSLSTDFEEGLPLIAGYFGEEQRKSMLKVWPKNMKSAESVWSNSIPPVDCLLRRATLMDFKNYLPEDILVKVDRASMLNSLELRSPFLDRHLIEFAFRDVNPAFKASSSDRKILLKALGRRVLPLDFDFKRKQGFSIPLDHWLKGGPFRTLFWEVLTDPSCAFNLSQTTKLLEGQDKGYSNTERLFCLTLFELWRDQYKVMM